MGDCVAGKGGRLLLPHAASGLPAHCLLAAEPPIMLANKVHLSPLPFPHPLFLLL